MLVAKAIDLSLSLSLFLSSSSKIQERKKEDLEKSSIDLMSARIISHVIISIQLA